MKKYIYFTKKGKFETENYFSIRFDKLHSPSEQIPALIDSKGNKKWLYKGKLHRLTGPAIVLENGFKEFYLRGKYYNTFKDWLKNIQIKIKHFKH